MVAGWYEEARVHLDWAIRLMQGDPLVWVAYFCRSLAQFGVCEYAKSAEDAVRARSQPLRIRRARGCWRLPASRRPDRAVSTLREGRARWPWFRVELVEKTLANDDPDLRARLAGALRGTIATIGS